MLWENKIGENKEQLELFEKYVNNKTVKDIEFMKTLSLISVASAGSAITASASIAPLVIKMDNSLGCLIAGVSLVVMPIIGGIFTFEATKSSLLTSAVVLFPYAVSGSVAICLSPDIKELGEKLDSTNSQELVAQFERLKNASPSTKLGKAGNSVGQVVTGTALCAHGLMSGGMLSMLLSIPLSCGITAYAVNVCASGFFFYRQPSFYQAACLFGTLSPVVIVPRFF